MLMTISPTLSPSQKRGRGERKPSLGVCHNFGVELFDGGVVGGGGRNPFRGVEKREGSNPSPLPERGKCSGHAYEGLKAGGSGGCDAVIVDVLLCQKG